MYFEGLNSDFANFMENKVKYNLYLNVYNMVWSNPLFIIQTFDDFYRFVPLFNFDSVTSSDPGDHPTNKVLILKKDYTTMISFKSDMETMEYSEIKTENTIDDIKYTLYYTYDKLTGEPARYKMTSSGNVTDENGYYLDSEVVS